MCHRRRPIQEALPVSLDAPLEKKTKHQPHKMERRWRGWWWWWRGGGDSTLVVLSLNEVLKLNWLRKWLMCIMELRVALHKGVC